MVRRLMVMLTGLMVAAGLGLPAEAAMRGTVRVGLEGQSGGEVILCLVAEDAQEGYRLLEAFGGGLIRREDALDGELAQWLSERLDGQGLSRELDGKGEAEFSDLARGLYLLVQSRATEGWLCAAPCLMSLPLDGQWEILAEPKTARLLTEAPKTGQHPAPLLAAMGLVLSGLGLYFCAERLRKR